MSHPPRARGLAPWLACASILVGLAGGACTHTTRTSPGDEEAPPLPEGRVALAMEALDGTPITLGGLRGRPVVLTVMTTWAEPALLEVPRLEAIRARYPEEALAIVSVALDEDPKMVRIFARTFAIRYTVATVLDRAGFTSDAGPLGAIRILPTTFLLDHEGRIAARMEGTWPAGALEEGVAGLVAGSGGTH